MSKNVVEPKILPGFMELLPEEQILLNKMMNIIVKTYESFGFSPIDTPALELTEVLLAKAGGETEKQVYSLTKGDHDLTMRFDLTVPLARYVAKNYHFLKFPFKRYQVGKVWRGERPQSGRFREFYQCDIDIIGDGELAIVNEAEIPAVIYHTFKNLGFQNFTIRINHRKILTGLCESIGAGDQTAEVLRVIDKIEKIGQEKVEKELILLGLSEDSVRRLMEFMAIDGTPEEICEALGRLDIENEAFGKGVEELTTVIQTIHHFGIPKENFKVDLTIARGLDYYTGTVYETILNDYKELGSVCSGGRYDDLAGYFTKKKLPGVGISIGLTRLFYQLHKSGMIKSGAATTIQCLVIPMMDDLNYVIGVATAFRSSGINTSVYVEQKGFKQKLSYANKIGVPFVVILGEDEKSLGKITLKDMVEGQQETLSLEEAIVRVKNMG
jgi:histidyl-tRNA synthetase